MSIVRISRLFQNMISQHDNSVASQHDVIGRASVGNFERLFFGQANRIIIRRFSGTGIFLDIRYLLNKIDPDGTQQFDPSRRAGTKNQAERDARRIRLG